LTAGGSSLPEVQRLVAALVAAKPGGRVAEIGTAFGEGAAAIAAVLPRDATFVTVEKDPERAAEARKRLAGTRAELLEAMWQDVLPQRGPFDLVFFDGGQRSNLNDVIELLAPGGILVKDDLTPGRAIDGDPVREAFLRDERLAAAEILVRPDMAAIVACRRA
jgi:predicted O-methyltransferase YrrM